MESRPSRKWFSQIGAFNMLVIIEFPNVRLTFHQNEPKVRIHSEIVWESHENTVCNFLLGLYYKKSKNVCIWCPKRVQFPNGIFDYGSQCTMAI